MKSNITEALIKEIWIEEAPSLNQVPRGGDDDNGDVNGDDGNNEEENGDEQSADGEVGDDANFDGKATIMEKFLSVCRGVILPQTI